MPGDPNAPDSLFLGYDYFGYTENPGSNFVLGTLAGGKRNFQGLEFVFRKRFANNWQLLSSYNWNDAEGNTNSDGNADFQGDVLFLDPRAPNQFGTQPGLIRHLVKGGGSYTFPFGLQLGATASWNSGTIASRTFLASGRNLPLRVPTAEAYLFGGIVDRWLAPDSVGSLDQPVVGPDRPARAVRAATSAAAAAEVFVDLFNVLDNQDAVRNQDLVAGQGGIAFGNGLQWVQPRRAFLGAAPALLAPVARPVAPPAGAGGSPPAPLSVPGDGSSRPCRSTFAATSSDAECRSRAHVRRTPGDDSVGIAAKFVAVLPRRRLGALLEITARNGHADSARQPRSTPCT